MMGEKATAFIETTTLTFRFLIITFNAFVARATPFLHPYSSKIEGKNESYFGVRGKEGPDFNMMCSTTLTETTCQRGL